MLESGIHSRHHKWEFDCRMKRNGSCIASVWEDMEDARIPGILRIDLDAHKFRIRRTDVKRLFKDISQASS